MKKKEAASKQAHINVLEKNYQDQLSRLVRLEKEARVIGAKPGGVRKLD